MDVRISCEPLLGTSSVKHATKRRDEATNAEYLYLCKGEFAMIHAKVRLR